MQDPRQPSTTDDSGARCAGSEAGSAYASNRRFPSILLDRARTRLPCPCTQRVTRATRPGCRLPGSPSSMHPNTITYVVAFAVVIDWPPPHPPTPS